MAPTPPLLNYHPISHHHHLLYCTVQYLVVTPQVRSGLQEPLQQPGSAAGAVPRAPAHPAAAVGAALGLHPLQSGGHPATGHTRDTRRHESSILMFVTAGAGGGVPLRLHGEARRHDQPRPAGAAAPAALARPARQALHRHVLRPRLPVHHQVQWLQHLDHHHRHVLVRVNSSGPQIILDKSLRDRVAPDEAQMFTFWVVSDH